MSVISISPVLGTAILVIVAAVAAATVVGHVDAFSLSPPVTNTGSMLTVSTTTTTTTPTLTTRSSRGTVMTLGMSSAAASFGDDDNHHHHHESSNKDHPLNKHLPGDFRRRAEFTDLEPIEESSDRRRRIQRETINSNKFVKHGESLWELRKLQQKLSHKLIKAINTGLRDRESEIREQLREAEKQDPEIVYKMELLRMRQAKSEGRDDDAREHGEKAFAARSCLPQFGLEGLWVGKYGQHGYEMINVTYHGDLLLAYKVTGDANVPRGELTFQADLSPLPPRIVGTGSSPTSTVPAAEPLQPISLTEKAAKKWGTTQLPRHKGLGQVAEPGFSNNQWMDGQLIIIGEEYFSFAWVPIEQQIFFGRPSPELALKMLRESGAASVASRPTFDEPPAIDSDVQILKDFAASCFEKTAEVEEEELSGDSFSCIWSGIDTEECYFQ
mmetsp:Transcript_52940/g.128407  ORF Transcript_52940/g.128407 Transcript_52940/m.128407 type:complete len:442 (-) Transcript_52940:141-1466(-)